MTFATVHRLYAAKDTPAIRVRGLSLSYHGRPALKDVTLPLYRGRITALVGPSGCGKTSLLSSINRMTDHIPRCTISGTIDALGHDVLSPGCDLVALRKQVGMIFQRPNPFPLSIAKNLDFPLREHGIKSRAERQTRIEEALRDVGLWDEVKDRLSDNALCLSGGQQQRLCFARALALRPDVLLLDEPCSALDPMASGIVEDLILTLRGRYTLVVVTHNMAQARRIADYVGVFWQHDGAGRLVEFGARAQIFDDPEHELTRAYVAGIRG